MSDLGFNELLDAGVHFGHLKRKWNPNMAPYIFMERNGIHIIDLNKTAEKLEVAASALKQIAKSGRKILFVATKKQAKDIVAEQVKKVNMPYVTERWPGGMLTNFPTIRKAVKKMGAIDNMASDGTFNTLSKRERLQITRQRAKLEKNLGSISDLTRLPAALFVVDISKEYIAVREARRLNIPVFAMVDTNSDPNMVDFPIPANDDASKSISMIVNMICESIEEGLNERRMEKEKDASREAGDEKTGQPDNAGEEEKSEPVEVKAGISDEEGDDSGPMKSKITKKKGDDEEDKAKAVTVKKAEKGAHEKGPGTEHAEKESTQIDPGKKE